MDTTVYVPIPDEGTAARPTVTPAVRARALTKTYGHGEAEVRALDGVDVDVEARATGLLGANGAGKTTFMKAVLGLVRPEAGAVSVLGLDASHEAGRIRTELGYMPEGECLPRDMTAVDLVVQLAELRGLPRSGRCCS